MTDPRPQDGEAPEETPGTSSAPATPVPSPEPHEMDSTALVPPIVETPDDLPTEPLPEPVNDEGLDAQDLVLEETFDLESPAPEPDPALEEAILAQVDRVYGEHPTDPEPPVEDPKPEIPEDLPPAQPQTPEELPPAQDTPEIKDPEPEGEIRAETEVPASALQVSFPVPTPADDFLEEEILPSTFEEPTLQRDQAQQWGNVQFTVTDALPRGWFKATSSTGENLLVHMQPQVLWGSLLAHRIAPKALYSGNEGVVFPDIEGEALHFPSSLPETLQVMESLSQYVFSLFKQGYALIDLDPDGLVLTPEGVRLRFPPRIARIGEPVTTVYREGFTAPEVMSGLAATGKEGVFFLGALMYRLLTGELLPAEGVSRALLGALPIAGVPQTLYQALQASHKRVDPAQWRAALNLLKPTSTVEWKVVARATVGLNPDRPVNEDSYAYRTEQVYTHHNRQTLLIACVSDGMGGMEAGEVASQAAVETFIRVANTEPIENAVWKCNQAVLDEMNGRDGGCTFSGIVARDSQVTLGHVGDTRAYHFSGCALKQISKDHSLVAALVASGMMTLEEAENSPDRNKVLRSLGSLKQHQPDYVMQLQFTVAVGDRILLLSDGVWGEVPFDDLQGFMEMPLEQAAEAMIQASLNSGAPDNATVLIAERVQ